MRKKVCRMMAQKCSGAREMQSLIIGNQIPGGSGGKVSACSVGDPGLISGSGSSSQEGNGNPLPVSLPGKSHGQRSLVGYNPRGRKGSDTTEQLHFNFHNQINLLKPLHLPKALR